jgi:transposase
LHPSTPLTQETVQTLIAEAPASVVTLVMNMQERIASLNADKARLQERIAELEAQNRPPAAPFRKPESKRTTAPKKPGRKKGHKGQCRPVPKLIDEIVEAPLPACPHCQGALDMLTPIVQYIEELPVVRPHVTQLTTYEGHCPCCNQTVRSTHPRQVSTASGCAGVHLGARALGLAAELKHGLGMTMRKSARALEIFGGLKISPGGLAQAFQRTAKKLACEEEKLHHQLLASPVVHSDETSWWQGGAPRSLWVFTTPGEQGLTLYRVVEHRDRSTFHSIVPPDWSSLLITDCLSVYDGATPRQHKCYSHHLKALSRARQNQDPKMAAPDGWFERARAFFTSAMEHKTAQTDLSVEERRIQRALLEAEADALFAPPRRDPAQESFRQRIAKQRDHLLSFLDEPLAEATNNLAERQLRGAVIARKVSCGNQTDEGASAWQTLSSLAATCLQRGASLVDFISQRLRVFPDG